VVDTDDGRRLEFTYAEVWGDDIHNWGQPFRCKICPDSQAGDGGSSSCKRRSRVIS
jgi:hypothetical protein